MLRTLILLKLALLLGACGVIQGTTGQTGSSSVAQGRIIDVARGREITRDALLKRLARADYVLLGEKHDNREHHALQAEVVRELQARARAPRAVAFEMMGTDQQITIVEHLATAGGDASGLGEALAWAESGWPDWATMYRPIAQAALDGGGEIVAANLPRDQIRAVFGSGAAALQPALVERSGLAEQLPDVLAVDLRNDLVESHCGHAGGEMVDGMFRVQRARDAIMADRLVAASGTGGGILIAGAQHVRVDRGVPWYVARLEPGADVVSVAFVEAAGSSSPKGGSRTGAGTDQLPDDLPFDYVWLTAPVPNATDPCAAFRRTADDRRPVDTPE